MNLSKFEFHEPTTVAAACELMAHYGAKARPLAGGTDLLVNMKKKVLNPEHLISLMRIAELTRLARSNGALWVGASVTVSEIAASEEAGKDFIALGQGAHALGTPLIRNLATIGGNIGSARPPAGGQGGDYIQGRRIGALRGQPGALR
jgi:carbon-monoxide dehydrogenase medium subunit